MTRPWFLPLSPPQGFTLRSSRIPLIGYKQNSDHTLTSNRRLNGGSLIGGRLAKTFPIVIYRVASELIRLRCAERAGEFAPTRNLEML